MFKIGDIVKFAPGVAELHGRFDTMRAEITDLCVVDYVRVNHLNSTDLGTHHYYPISDLVLADSYHQHTLKTYIGFTEIYDYCTECGEKV